MPGASLAGHSIRRDRRRAFRAVPTVGPKAAASLTRHLRAQVPGAGLQSDGETLPANCTCTRPLGAVRDVLGSGALKLGVLFVSRSASVSTDEEALPRVAKQGSSMIDARNRVEHLRSASSNLHSSCYVFCLFLRASLPFCDAVRVPVRWTPNRGVHIILGRGRTRVWGMGEK